MYSEKSESKKRISICNSCPYYRSKVKICRKCGCFMPAKILFKNNTCPIGKW